MGDIARYSSTGQVVGAKATETVGAGADVNNTDWSGKTIAFSELNAPVTAGGTIITESVEDDKRVRRNRKSGRHFMRRIGWQARLDRIVVVVCERDVVPQPDGRFKPQGEWRITSTTEHLCEGPVKNRTGEVIDDSVNPSIDATHRDIPEALDDTTSKQSERDLSYLPRAVRSGVLQLVPSPTYFHCQAVQYSVDGRPTHHRVAALRMSSTSAVVVLASRQRTADTWQVQQVQYKLSVPTDPIEPSRVPRLP